MGLSFGIFVQQGILPLHVSVLAFKDLVNDAQLFILNSVQGVNQNSFVVQNTENVNALYLKKCCILIEISL